MIHPFCCVSGLHQRASIVLDVCDWYVAVEAVSEGGSVCNSSNCLPLPLPFLLFLPLFLLLLWLLSLFFELLSALPPGLEQSFTQCPVPQQVLHVLMSVLLVLLVFFVCESSFLVLVFACVLPLAFLDRVDLHPVVITCSISS